MTYEIVPASNGFILRLFQVQTVAVGVRQYQLGAALQEERVYPTLNAPINDLKALLSPPA